MKAVLKSGTDVEQEAAVAAMVEVANDLDNVKLFQVHAVYFQKKKKKEKEEKKKRKTFLIVYNYLNLLEYNAHVMSNSKWEEKYHRRQKDIRACWWRISQGGHILTLLDHAQNIANKYRVLRASGRGHKDD